MRFMVNAEIKSKAESWPPKELALPDTVERIEAGRVEQQERFEERPDDSRQARLQRIVKHRAA